MTFLRSLFGDEADILLDRNFQVLLLAGLAGPLGPALLSPILESLIHPFGTSPANIGLMFSFYTAPAIVVIPLAGILADRYGRKPVLVIALLIFGMAGSAIAFTTDYGIVLGLRLLQGVASGGLVPIIVTSIGDIYDGAAEATAQGLRFTNSGLTQAVFPLLSGMLVVIAWQYPFLLYAVTIPIGVIVYIWLDEPTDLHRAEMTVLDSDNTKAHLWALFRLVKQRRTLAMVIARGLPVVVIIGFLTYNSIIIVRIMDGTPAQAGMISAIFSLSFAFSASQAGRITAMFNSWLYPLIWANICLGVGFTIFLFAPSILIASIGIAIVGVGIGITLTLYRSIITGLASNSLRGGLVSLSEAFSRVCSTMTPIFMGGIIAVASPKVGIESAVQIAGLSITIVGSVGGVICLLIASSTSPVLNSE